MQNMAESTCILMDKCDGFRNKQELEHAWRLHMYLVKLKGCYVFALRLVSNSETMWKMLQPLPSLFK